MKIPAWLWSPWTSSRSSTSCWRWGSSGPMVIAAQIGRGAVWILLLALASGCDAFGPDNLPPPLDV